MYQFIIHNNRNRSYNFIEKDLEKIDVGSPSSSSGLNIGTENIDFRGFYEQFEKYLRNKQIDVKDVSALITVIEDKEIESENDTDVKHFKSLKAKLEKAKEDKVEIENLSDFKALIFGNAQNNMKNNETTLDQFTLDLQSMTGVGKSVSNDVMHNFIGYLKQRAINENGTVYSRHFDEPDCPQMI